MLSETMREQISTLYLMGIINPTKIAEELELPDTLEVAQFVDLNFWRIDAPWQEDYPATEIYTADSFPELVDKMPALLQSTREGLKTQFYKLYGCRLFERLISESLTGSTLSVRSPQDFDREKEIHYLYLSVDSSGNARVFHARHLQEREAWYTFYVGRNYYVVVAPSIVANWKMVGELAQQMFRRYADRISEFSLEHLPEETPVVEELRFCLLKAVNDGAPIAGRFCELPFIGILRNRNVGRNKSLSEHERNLLDPYLMGREVSLLTPARIDIYRALAGSERQVASQIFFPLHRDQVRSNNLATLAARIISELPCAYPEELDATKEFKSEFPYLFSSSRLAEPISLLEFLVTEVPNYGLLTKEKAKMILAESDSRKRRYILDRFLGFHEYRSRYSRRIGRDKLKRLSTQVRRNVQVLVKTYALQKGVHIDDLEPGELNDLYGGLGSSFGLPHPRHYVFLNRAFPDEYGRLTEDKAKLILGEKDRHRREHFIATYFNDGRKRDFSFYDSVELASIRQRCLHNARIMVRAYLALHPREQLESLGVEEFDEISDRLVENVTGKRSAPKLCLNRLFPDEFGVLTEEKAARFLASSTSEQSKLSWAYFQIIGENSVDQLYDENERVRIHRRTVQNARTLVQHYLNQTGKILEEISLKGDGKLLRRNIFPTIVYRCIYRHKVVESESRSLPLLLSALFPEEYGRLDREKFNRWQQGVSGRYRKGGKRQGVFTEAFFGLHNLDVWEEGQRRNLKRRSLDNARMSLQFLLEKVRLDDIGDLNTRTARKIIPVKFFELFAVHHGYFELLRQIYPDDFGVLTYTRTKEYSRRMDGRRRIAMAHRDQLFVEKTPKKEEKKSGKLNQSPQLEEVGTSKNAIIVFLWMLRENVRVGGSIDPLEAGDQSDAIYDVFAPSVRRKARELHKKIGPILHRHINPDAFFWFNVFEYADPVIFLELYNSDNLSYLEEIPQSIRGTYVRRICASRYPYTMQERNAGLQETKIRLLQTLTEGDEAYISIDDLEGAFVALLQDRYENVRIRAIQSLAATSYVQPTFIETVYRRAMLAGTFRYGEVRRFRLHVDLSVIGVAVNRILQDISQQVGIVGQGLGGTWHDRYEGLVKMLRRATADLLRTEKESHKAFVIAQTILANNVMFVEIAAAELLVRNVDRFDKALASATIPLLETLLLHDDERIQKRGVAILHGIERWAPRFTEEEQEQYAAVLQRIQQSKEREEA